MVNNETDDLVKSFFIPLRGDLCETKSFMALGDCLRIAQAVIPAKAGIYKYLKRLDSRLRGND